MKVSDSLLEERPQLYPCFDGHISAGSKVSSSRFSMKFKRGRGLHKWRVEKWKPRHSNGKQHCPRQSGGSIRPRHVWLTGFNLIYDQESTQGVARGHDRWSQRSMETRWSGRCVIWKEVSDCIALQETETWALGRQFWNEARSWARCEPH